MSTYKLSNNILPGIVTSRKKSLLYNKFTKSISGISNNLLVKQQIQNLEKIEDEVIMQSTLEDDVNFLEMDYNQFLSRENKKKEVSSQNQNNYSINVKEIYPKLVLVPFKSYIRTSRLYTGGFIHKFNLFLTLENLDKIKDFKIINLN